MITLFGYEIGMLSFFAFSFIAGIVIASQAIFGCKAETPRHRVVRACVGLVYAVIAVVAFSQLEVAESPYIAQFLPAVMLLRTGVKRG